MTWPFYLLGVYQVGAVPSRKARTTLTSIKARIVALVRREYLVVSSASRRSPSYRPPSSNSVPCQSSARSDLLVYAQDSCPFASSICSWYGAFG